MMGKKKPLKTKEAIAIEDASSAAADASGEETKLPTPPRKRGRPRKVIGIQYAEQQQLLVQGEDKSEGGEQSKKAEATYEQEKEKGEEKLMITKSRARRKSIPRKSS